MHSEINLVLPLLSTGFIFLLIYVYIPCDTKLIDVIKIKFILIQTEGNLSKVYTLDIYMCLSYLVCLCINELCSLLLYLHNYVHIICG